MLKGKLCIMSCHNFQPEIEAAIIAEGWNDVVVASYPVRCGHPPVSWSELAALLPEDVSRVIISGRACLTDLASPPPDWTEVIIDKQEYCFHWFAENTLIAELINQGAYLMTPPWLSDWRGKLAEMGFHKGHATEFFHDFARELILLDTGIDPKAGENLREMSRYMNLPCQQLPVGLDHIKLKLHRLVESWRQKEVQKKILEQEQTYSKKMAEHVAVMNLLGELALMTEEDKAIELILNLFRSLFAPKWLFYLPFREGGFIAPADLPPLFSEELRNIREGNDWVVRKNGFIITLKQKSQILGAMVVDELTFPEFKDRYLNFALSASSVLALAIENSRTFKRMQDKENDLMQLNQELDSFVYIASHDLQEPLRKVIGFGERLSLHLGEGLDGKAKDYLDRMTGAATRMGGLIDDLLTISRLKTRSRPFEPIDLNQVAKDVLSDLEEPLEESGARISVEPLPVIFGERTHLRQLFQNLLGNALKFRRNGTECVISVKALMNDQPLALNGVTYAPQTVLSLAFRDNGIGFDEKYSDRIFGLFQRLHGRSEYSGSGVGLAICKKVVDHHGGLIKVESTPGVGSCFTVFLPVCQAKPKE